jgi:ribosomal protein S27AE
MKTDETESTLKRQSCPRCGHPLKSLIPNPSTGVRHICMRCGWAEDMEPGALISIPDYPSCVRLLDGLTNELTKHGTRSEIGGAFSHNIVIYWSDAEGRWLWRMGAMTPREEDAINMKAP